ncbi:hypothetical protein Trydic_g23406 [Trypoxylus dichotomus]
MSYAVAAKYMAKSKSSVAKWVKEYKIKNIDDSLKRRLDERLVRNVSQTFIDTIPAGQDKETGIVDESLEIPWEDVHRSTRKQYRKDEGKRRAAERESEHQTSTTTGQRVKPEEMKVNVNAVRKTKIGGILIELRRSSSNCEGFTNQLQEASREKAQVSTLQPKLKLEFKDLDCLTTVEEVTEAIRKAFYEIAKLTRR